MTSTKCPPYTHMAVNVRDHSDRTALWYAAKLGNIEIVSTLVSKAGIELDTLSKDGTTPLMNSVAEGHEAVREILLNQGQEKFDISRQAAASKGMLELINLLDQRQLRWQPVAADGATAFDLQSLRDALVPHAGEAKPGSRGGNGGRRRKVRPPALKGRR
ncbi:hypothetical protein BDZ91DRAFT_751891 [Kalaharituber pfeilii]|nr:hypothetical protein BDZ91DRAFT_751891 [Kalaharituber pfeilii]